MIARAIHTEIFCSNLYCQFFQTETKFYDYYAILHSSIILMILFNNVVEFVC